MKLDRILFCVLASIGLSMAANTWNGPFHIKTLSFDQDDFSLGKRRIEVTVQENNYIYRAITNDASFPSTDLEGLKLLFSALESAQAQKAKFMIFSENLDANGNWKFIGVKLVQ